jgi:hypothetical protein
MKTAAIVLCALVWTSAAGAVRDRRHNSPLRRATLAGIEYKNISRTWQTIDLSGKDILVFSPVVSGVAVTAGHSFLVHERPLAHIVHFGFDVTWFDLEYGYWYKKIDGNHKWMHKVDVAVGVGPAVHVSPFRRFGVHAYFHYNPTYSFVTHNFAGDEEGKFELVSGFASYFSTGLAVSWSVFSIGGEYRHGGGLYRGIHIPDVTFSSTDIAKDIDEIVDFETKDMLDRKRHRMSGWRLYLSFRF